MARFRKRPVEIEAVHLTESVQPEEIARWCGGKVALHPDEQHTGGRLVIAIETLEGTMRAEPGDWIIKGVKGEFYPCKPDIFEATYERTVEGLRELRDWVERQIASVGRCRERDEDDKRRDYLLGCEGGYEYVLTRIDYMLRSAPSDSRGDQKRCGGTGQIARKDAALDEWVTVDCPGCPDCNPAPTQAEGDECERCEGTRFEAPGRSCSACVRVSLLPAAVSGQPEGGDEEDWPSSIELAQFKGPELTGPIYVPADPEKARSNGAEVRRYVPATSQDSSGLEEKATFWEGVANKEKADKQELQTALDKAEAERDRLAKLASERLTLLEGPEPFNRAETVLEELAAEFERRAAANETARDEDGRAQNVDGEAYHQGRGHSNRQAASLAREKAAKLKEDRR